MFTSTVDMPYQTLVEDFSHFFMKSGQTETAFRCYSCYNEESEILYRRGILFHRAGSEHEKGMAKFRCQISGMQEGQ